MCIQKTSTAFFKVSIVLLLLSCLFIGIAGAVDYLPIGWMHPYDPFGTGDAYPPPNMKDEWRAVCWIDINYPGADIFNQEYSKFHDSNGLVLIKSTCAEDSMMKYVLQDGTIKVISGVNPNPHDDDVDPSYPNFFYDVGPGGLNWSDGTKANWYKRSPFSIEKLTKWGIGNDPVDFEADNIPKLSRAFQNITKYYGSKPDFGGYSISEEFPLNSERGEYFDIWDNPDLWTNIESMIDAATESRDPSNNQPLVFGNGFGNFAYEFGRTSDYDHYGQVIPNYGTRFFDRDIDRDMDWDVIYAWKHALDINFRKFYQGDPDGDGCDKYQYVWHRHMYMMRWLSDRIRQMNDEYDTNKEWWYGLQADKQIVYQPVALPEPSMYDPIVNELDDHYKKLHRRMTPSEYYMLPNLALASGAKGILIYTLTGAHGSFEEGHLNWDEFDSGDFTDFRRPYDNTFPQPVHQYNNDDDEVDRRSVLSHEPYENASVMMEELKEPLRLLREMTWVTTANAHTNILMHTLEQEDIEDEYTSGNGYPDSDDYGSDLNRIGDTEDFFFLIDVEDAGDYTFNDATSGLRYSANITVGFFKWPEQDFNSQYYYVVNTKCNRDDPGNEEDEIYVIDAEPKTIQLEFELPDGPNYMLTDMISGEEIDMYQEGRDLWISDDIVIGPGRARLLRYSPVRAPVNTVITQNTTWTGIVNVENNVSVQDGATLTIDPDTRVLMGAGTEIRVWENSSIQAGDLEDDPVYFYPSTYSGDPEIRDWHGIFIQNVNHNDFFENCVINRAEYGIAVGNLQGINDEVRIEECLIEDCDTGILFFKARNTSIINTEIRNCGIGISNEQSTNPPDDEHYMEEVTIENMDNVGMRFSNLNKVVIKDSRIQRCGDQGISFENVGIAHIGPAIEDSFVPVVIRYNGNNDPDVFAALEVSGTYMFRYRKSFVYENSGTGLHALNNAAVSPNNQTSGIHDSNILGNNALQLDFNPIRRTQLLIDGDSNAFWNIRYAGYDFFDNYSANPPWYLYYLKEFIPPPFYLYIDQNWFDIDPPDNNINVSVQYPAGLDANANRDDNDYWQYSIMDENTDRLGRALYRAYVVLDSLDDPESAIEIFDDLVSLKHPPALKGIATAMIRNGERARSVVGYFENIPLDSTYEDFNREITFAKASLHQFLGDYDESRRSFRNISDREMIRVPDSLRALLGVEECNLLEEHGNLFNIRRRGPMSAGVTERQIEVIEDRIKELKDELADYYSGTGKYEERLIPNDFQLSAAYPNPFNPTVNIPFGLPKKANVNIAVYNILGQHVANLIDRQLMSGYHTAVWEGVSKEGIPVSSGIYFVKMEAGGFVKTNKIVLLK
ncbi:MAG: T9SS type A sorting domain-containing protein [Candidatus Electryonea clarkiae]|nr:T9SS type A sorting domain-containing protein [Candidatus Electryonea clarkiae]MDP8286498.1 T9SS type A sorting domain-containing protein [Candidatus Electryonea clarkiae]